MKKDKPIISVCDMAKRPQYWMKMYNSLCSNDIPFEVIYVGPKSPKFTLPDNFKFIYSKVKPAQAAEIASRRSTGEFLIHIPDDHTLSKGALDILYKTYLRYLDEKIVVSCVMNQNRKPIKKGLDNFILYNLETPRIPLQALFNKKIWDRLGGIDKNFISSLWDVDMAMRIIEIGGSMIHCEDVISNEYVTDRERERRLIGKKLGGVSDRKYLHKAWVIGKNKMSKKAWATGDNKMSKKRLIPSISFKSKKILERSERPRGEWK